MVRGLLVLGLMAALLLLTAMGTGLATTPYHRWIGTFAAALGSGIPLLVWAISAGNGRGGEAVLPRKIRARLVPFVAWQAILLGLTAWTGWSGAMNGPMGWFHGLLGGLATGFGLVAMVVAWASLVARQRVLQGKRP